MSLCPCCSGVDYESCCGPFISLVTKPRTPEQCMRSRYTAFTQGNMDYLKKTMVGSPLKTIDANATKEWATRVKWTGLVVHEVSTITASSLRGTVRFSASYIDGDKQHVINEYSVFKKDNNSWRYSGELNEKMKEADT